MATEYITMQMETPTLENGLTIEGLFHGNINLSLFVRTLKQHDFYKFVAAYMKERAVEGFCQSNPI